MSGPAFRPFRRRCRTPSKPIGLCPLPTHSGHDRFRPIAVISARTHGSEMTRLEVFARSYTALLVAALLAGLAGLAFGLVMFIARAQVEPMLPLLLPAITTALLGSALFYKPEQYYWLATYISLLSAVFAAGIAYAFIRRPAENRRIDAALRGRLGPDQARGAPLEP
jgi:hypothetical protein